MPQRILSPCLFLLALVACNDSADAPEKAETTARNPDAARAACFSATLAARAEGDLATLDSAFTRTGTEDPLQATTANAAVQYARAFQQYASVRAAELAYRDSAANYARTPADSTRFSETAVRFGLRAPEPGTIEANVANAYARDYATLRNDADHPCNWNI